MDGLEPVKEKPKIWSACKVVRFHRSKWRRKRSKIWYRANYWCLYDSSIVLPFTRVFMRNVAVKHGQAPVIHLMLKFMK